MITRGGVKRILVRACAKRGIAETGSGGSGEDFCRHWDQLQTLSPSDMMVVDDKEGEGRRWLGGCV